jgi:hypothetical protein
MKLKKHCCEKYRRKAKVCKGCPVMALLSDKKRRRRLKKIRRALQKAA